MIIRLTTNKSSIEINSLGAELLSFNYNNKNYIWTIDEKFWNKTSPVLFPIVGRLKNDEYTFSENTYQLPRHGFARNQEFEVKDQTENTVVFLLKETSETFVNYPFKFELTIQYILEETELKIAYSVKNNNDIPMPFSLGAHPAFAIDSDFEDFSLNFKEDDVLIHNELINENFTGNKTLIPLRDHTLQLSYSLFENDAIVLKQLNSKKITLFKKNIPYLAVDFNGFSNLGIWTKPEAPFLCIEPWCGFADSTNTSGDILTKDGIITVNPDQEFKTSFSILIL